MKFKNIEDLTNLINTELGGFCDKFQYKRKELVELSKAKVVSQANSVLPCCFGKSKTD